MLRIVSSFFILQGPIVTG